MNLASQYLGNLPPAKTSLAAAKPHPKSTHEQLVHQTEVWVAQTFYGQLLKQMRNGPFKSEMFSGGRGGEAFGSMLDQRLSERMSKGAGAKLVKAIVRRVEAHSAYAAQSKLPATSRSAAATANLGKLHVTTTD